jgi:hypothetical protein
LAEQSAKESDIQIPPRRQDETAAAYQRRVSVARIAIAAQGRALAEQSTKESDIQIPPRRHNETEAAYNRRVSVARNAIVARRRASDQMPKIYSKQAGESDEAYQSRLRLTIKGLLMQQYPNPVQKQRDESEAAYQARAGAALRAIEMRRSSLVARPGEEETAYLARLTASKERKSSISSSKRAGESTNASQAHVETEEKASRTSPPK